MHTQSWEVLKIISSLEAHSSGRLHQRSGVRESCVRGGAASWPKFGGRGGVRRRAGMQSRGARGVGQAWADSPAIAHFGHGTEEEEFFPEF